MVIAMIAVGFLYDLVVDCGFSRGTLLEGSTGPEEYLKTRCLDMSPFDDLICRDRLERSKSLLTLAPNSSTSGSHGNIHSQCKVPDNAQ